MSIQCDGLGAAGTGGDDPHSGTDGEATGDRVDTGIVHLRGVLPAASCAAWCARSARALGAATSLRLAALPGWTVEAVWREVGAALGPLCRGRLGAPLLCDADECWLRRQHGPSPAPHRWHQDGALRHDFIAQPEPTGVPGALLNMLTCWITFTPCGADAPGLELLPRRFAGLWSLAQLAQGPAQADGAALLRPVLAAGDVLVFGGDTLHRTHATPSMAGSRISLELRLFPSPALPPRLRGDRAVMLPMPPEPPP